MLFAETELLENLPVVKGHNVLVIRNLIKKKIGHTYFLPLIDKGRTAEQKIHCRKHFSAFYTVFDVAVAFNNSCVIVVFDIQAVPALGIKTVLPF